MRAADVDCRTVVNLVGRWLDGGLTVVDRDAFEQHVLACPVCRYLNTQLVTITNALAAAEPAVPAEVVLAGIEDELRRM